jgi:hypothetical protein
MRQYLTRAEAAAYLTERGLPISKNTLQKMATNFWKQGPAPARAIGRMGRIEIVRAEALDQPSRVSAGRKWREARPGGDRKRASEDCRHWQVLIF